MWQCPDEPEDEAHAPPEPAPVVVVAEDGPNTDLVLELVSDYVQSAMFSSLARVDRRFAAKARPLLDAFLDRLVATSQRLGARSAERTKAFWKLYREVSADELQRITGITHALSYEDREEWHYWNDEAKEARRRGAGTCEDMYSGTIPTRGKTFSEQTCRRNFEVALANTKKPCHYYSERKRHAWNRRHALCSPFFVCGPINFFKRMAIPNSALYDIVVHGDASGVRTEGFGHRHHRFFVKRLLEERAPSSGGA